MIFAVSAFNKRTSFAASVAKSCEVTEMEFLKMYPEYGLEVYKYCAKSFLKIENMKERKNTKPALFIFINMCKK